MHLSLGGLVQALERAVSEAPVSESEAAGGPPPSLQGGVELGVELAPRVVVRRLLRWLAARGPWRSAELFAEDVQGVLRQARGARPEREVGASSRPWSPRPVGEGLGIDEGSAPASRAAWLAEVEQDASALQRAPAECRRDREIVLEVLRQDSSLLQLASEELAYDHTFVLAAVRLGGKVGRAVLRWMPEHVRRDPVLCDDRIFALEAVRSDGMALRHLSPRLRAEREVVLAAVRRDARALLLAHAPLRAERAFVLEAVRRNGHALAHAPQEFHADREIVLVAVSVNCHALQWATEPLRGDPEIVLAAVEQDAAYLASAPAALLSDRDFALSVVRRKGRALSHLPPEHVYIYIYIF